VTERLDADVVVVGNGVAASMAALSAAEAGASVVQIAGPPGATALSSGAVDLAGAFGRLDEPVERALSLLVSRAPTHPLALIGREASLELATESAERLAAMGDLYAARSPEALPRVAATGVGGLHRAWLLQATQADLREHVGGIVGVADLGPACPVSAWLTEGALQNELESAEMDLALERIRVELPPRLVVMKPLLLAQRLDEDDQARESFGAALADAVSGHQLAALLIPPIAGLDHAVGVCTSWTEAAGVPVVELLGRPGDPPGMRLHRLLERAVDESEIRRIRGKATPETLEADHLEALTMNGRDGETEVRARSFVIATGGLAGGGLTLGRTLSEELFDLAIMFDGSVVEPPSSLLGEDRHNLYSSKLAMDHPIHRAGVMVDASLRPARDGEPVFQNLFAAGAILADHDPVADGSGLATAMITGVCAGRSAAGDSG